MQLTTLKRAALALILISQAGLGQAASYQYRQYIPGFAGKPVAPPGQPSLIYSWFPGSWETCSCATQSQVRPIECRASDNTTVADPFCTDTKPASTQSCTPAVGACDLTGTPLATGVSAYTVDAQGFLIVAVINGSGMDLKRYQDTNLIGTMYQNCNPVASNMTILPSASGHFVMACSHTVGSFSTTRTHTVGLQVFNNDLTLASTKSVTGYAGPLPLPQPPYLSTIQLSGYDGYDFDTTQASFDVGATGTLTQTAVINTDNQTYSASYASAYAEGVNRYAFSTISGGWGNSAFNGLCRHVKSPATSTRYRYCRWGDTTTATDYKTCIHNDVSDTDLQISTTSTVNKCFSLPSANWGSHDIPFIDGSGTLYSMRGGTVYRISSGF